MKNILLSFLVLALIGTVVLWVRYGGGTPYPDLSTAPVLDASALEEVLAFDEPIGNVAVNRDGRIFFTVHPELLKSTLLVSFPGCDDDPATAGR